MKINLGDQVVATLPKLAGIEFSGVVVGHNDMGQYCIVTDYEITIEKRLGKKRPFNSQYVLDELPTVYNWLPNVRDFYHEAKIALWIFPINILEIIPCGNDGEKT